MSSVRLAATVALLAVLAGCGTGTPETATPVTPAPVPTGDERAGASFAPGVDETGIYDADALLDAHFGRLANTSYTVRLSSVRRARDRSLLARHDRTLRVAGDDRFHYVLTVEQHDGRNRRIERWRADGEAYTAVTVGNNTTYRPLTRPAPPGLVTQAELRRLFRFVPSRLSDTGGQADTARYRVTGGPRDLPPLSNVSYTLRLTNGGLIRSYNVTYVTTRQDRPRQVTVDASFSAVGATTVDPPSRDAPGANTSAAGDEAGA